MTVTLNEVKNVVASAEAEARERKLNGKMRVALVEKYLDVLYAGAPEEERNAPLTDERFVSERDVVKAALRASGGSAETMTQALNRIFGRAPRMPEIMGLAEAADAVGLRKPHLYRLRDNGRLPEPIAELANGPVFLASEINVLAKQLQGERAEKARRKEEAT